MSEITSYGLALKDGYPDKYKKLVEAMNKSKGKVNNVLGLLLAMSDTTTADDVVKMASGIGSKREDLEKLQPVLGYGYNSRPWEVQSGRTKERILSRRKRIREDRFNAGFKYELRDTYIYRAMVKMGLQSTLEKENCWWGRNRYSVLESRRNELNISEYTQAVAMFYHTPANLRELIINDKNLNQLWMEQAKIQRQISKPWSDKEREQHPVTSTDEEWRKFQTTHIIKEFDQLAHMPEDKKKAMNEWIEWYGDKVHRGYSVEKLPPITMHTILHGFKYPCEDKTIELIREAFGVMEYMGIGVCWNFVEREDIMLDDKGETMYDENGNTMYKKAYRPADNRQTSYKVGALLRHVSSSMRRFAADIKKGFGVKDVRELVVEDLNSWSVIQARGHWQFFERTDAPKEYPDLQKKKKGNKKSNKIETQDLELTEAELAVVAKFNAEKGKGNKDVTEHES